MDLNTAKGIGLVIFFLITIVPGSIPIFLFSTCKARVNSRRGQYVISLLNCFAGGVFLATCLLSLLAEGYEEYEGFKEAAGYDNEYPFFHLGIAVGFFLVALVERFAVFLSTDDDDSDKNDEQSKYERLDHFGDSRKVVSESGVELTAVNGNGQIITTAKQPPSISVVHSGSSHPTSLDMSSVDHKQLTNGLNDQRFSSQTGVRAVVLLLALSFHTIFDGLAVGLQESSADVWTVTVGISIHKTIVAVSLGLELANAMHNRSLKAFLLLLFFAFMAPLGVGIGMGITSGHVNERAHLLAGSILQAVSTGSFLYVTFFEVLGQELGHNSSVLKILVAVLGFAAMAVGKIWDED